MTSEKTNETHQAPSPPQRYRNIRMAGLCYYSLRLRAAQFWLTRRRLSDISRRFPDRVARTSDGHL